MNKRQLYESIMRNVSHEVKKALNEASDNTFYNAANKALQKADATNSRIEKKYYKNLANKFNNYGNDKNRYDLNVLQSAASPHFRVQRGNEKDEYRLFPANNDMVRAFDGYSGYSTDGETWITVYKNGNLWEIGSIHAIGSSSGTDYEEYFDDNMINSENIKEFIDNILAALLVNEDDEDDEDNNNYKSSYNPVNDVVLNTPINKTFDNIYNKFYNLMHQLDLKIDEIVSNFCRNNKEYSDYCVEMKYNLQAGWEGDLWLTDKKGEPMTQNEFNSEADDKQFMNYGYVNNIPAWTNIFWTFGVDNKCKFPEFFYDILKEIKKNPKMKLFYNKYVSFIVEKDINCTHAIYAINMPVDEALDILLKMYKTYVDLLPAALQKIANNKKQYIWW